MDSLLLMLDELIAKEARPVDRRDATLASLRNPTAQGPDPWQRKSDLATNSSSFAMAQHSRRPASPSVTAVRNLHLRDYPYAASSIRLDVSIMMPCASRRSRPARLDPSSKRWW